MVGGKRLKKEREGRRRRWEEKGDKEKESKINLRKLFKMKNGKS